MKHLYKAIELIAKSIHSASNTIHEAVQKTFAVFWTGNSIALPIASAVLATAVLPAGAAATSWVGEMTEDGEATFFRLGPQIFAGPELLFHLPNDLIFNQQVRNLVVDDTNISFGVARDNREVVSEYSAHFDGNKFVGEMQGGDNGKFFLHPVVSVPDNAELNSYAGNYQLADGRVRTVGFEDLAGMVETRLYYSDGENFVLLYPISKSEFFTGNGETIRFNQDGNTVQGMTITSRTSSQTIPKVNLYREKQIGFKSADADISGTIFVPNTPGPHPAVIIAHSSGGGERHAYWLFASQFAQDGLAVLTYDRRGHGASTGGGPFNLDTDILAEDMKAAYAFLQSRDDIDRTRIGLMGFSNGSWVAPRAAQDLPGVAFLSVSMASAVSQVDAELFRRKSVLQAVGVSEASIEQAMEALQYYYKAGVSGLTAVEESEFAEMYSLVAANEELQNANGFRVLPTDTPLDEILSSSGSLAYMGFSPTDAYRTLDAAIAVHIGEYDENIPPAMTMGAMDQLMAQRPDADISLVVHAGATHGLFVLPAQIRGISQDILYPNLASFEFSPGYISQLRSWLISKSGLPSQK
jgi:hypothetical protein